MFFLLEGLLNIQPQKDPPAKYKVGKANKAYMLGVPAGTDIMLENHSDDDTLHLPDRRYLCLHAACSKIAHASGAATLIDQFLRDYEELPTLAGDGSSYMVLEQALRHG